MVELIALPGFEFRLSPAVSRGVKGVCMCFAICSTTSWLCSVISMASTRLPQNWYRLEIETASKKCLDELHERAV